MIETEAQVIRVEREKAWVRIKPHRPCGHCDPEKGCKSVALTRMFGAQQDFCVANPLAAAEGDLVKVAVSEDVLLKTAVWAYGVPVLLLLIAAALGQWLAPSGWNNAVSIAGGLVGLAAGFALLRKQRQLATQARPVIIDLAGAASSPCQSTHY